MPFVYIHIAWFGCWIGFGVEKYPFGLLTMIVSLEAIFLSTFVMISQNRADAKRQAIADQQWQTVKEEDRQNEELLELSRQILELTKAIHAETPSRPARKREATLRSRARAPDAAGASCWQHGRRRWQRSGIDAVQVSRCKRQPRNGR